MDVGYGTSALDLAVTCGGTADQAESPCGHGLGSQSPDGSASAVDARPSSAAHHDLLAFVEGPALRDFSRRLGAATSAWGA